MNAAAGWLDLYAGLLELVLFCGVLGQMHTAGRSRSSAAYVLMLAFACLASSAHGALALLGADAPLSLIRVLMAFISVMFYLLTCAAVWYYLEVIRASGEARGYALLWVSAAVCAIGAFVWVHSFFYTTIFDVRTMTFTGTAGLIVSYIPGVWIVVLLTGLLLRHGRAVGVQNALLLALLPVQPLLTSLLSRFTPIPNLQYPMIFVALLSIYVMLHLRLERRLREQARVNTRLRVYSAIGRVQPHFIYNVLTSIYYLCDSDPKTAQRAIGYFSDYLRRALEVLERQRLVPLEWELGLVDSYLSLERMRFRDSFRVEYDIAADGFQLPPFTIQVLVENALKHGLRDRGGGLIRVSSARVDGGFTVTVADNGVGCDASGAEPEGVHTGLNNTRERLSLLANGTLTVTGSPGAGTTAVVFLPAG